MEFRETKPSNYSFVTANLIRTIAVPGKRKALLELERILLNSAIRIPPEERLVSLWQVRVFGEQEGSPALRKKLLRVWFSQIEVSRRIAGKLLKRSRIRYN
ncbi:MAG: hypothetical protein HYU64_11500 [Armatimonadetes bacterium]|nr:hypothetical protein [Armatimonadota bacterium]